MAKGAGRGHSGGYRWQSAGGVSSGSKTVQKEVGKQQCQHQPAGPGRPTEQHVCLSTKGHVQIKAETVPKSGLAGPQGWTQPKNRVQYQPHSAPGPTSGSGTSVVTKGCWLPWAYLPTWPAEGGLGMWAACTQPSLPGPPI